MKRPSLLLLVVCLLAASAFTFPGERYVFGTGSSGWMTGLVSALAASNGPIQVESHSAALLNTTHHPLTPLNPFLQDWTDTNQITTFDNWGGVPSIMGYMGNGLVSSAGVDPQTILGDETTTELDINPNQLNPNTF